MRIGVTVRLAYLGRYLSSPSRSRSRERVTHQPLLDLRAPISTRRSSDAFRVPMSCMSSWKFTLGRSKALPTVLGAKTGIILKP